MSMHPRVFISHSTQDHATAEQLDRDLRELGIDPWASFWEIKAGDSIVKKINEGLENCSAFLILISKDSVASAWVARELDAATVQHIKQKTTIIPVRLDDAPVPPLLDSLRYVDLRDYQASIAEIADVVHGRRTRPPVKPAPPATASDDAHYIRGAPAAILLESVKRADADPECWGMDADEAMREFELTADEYADAVEELARHNLVVLDGNAAHASGFARARILPAAFVQAIGQVIPEVNPRADLGILLSEIAKGGRQGVSSQTVRAAVDIPETRGSWYVDFLDETGLIEIHGKNGALPLGFDWAQITPSGRHELKAPSVIELGGQRSERPLDRSVDPPLSREARILLFHASKDRHGHILKWHTNIGRHVQANEKVWPKQYSARASAVWHGALQELSDRRLVEQTGSSGDVFTLTAKGFEVADALGLDADE